MWKTFVDAPGYIEYSPWFPNPFICLRDMIHSGETEIYHRAMPWNGVGTWMKETWERVYATWFWDTTSLLIYPLILAFLFTVLRVVMDKMVFKVRAFDTVCVCVCACMCESVCVYHPISRLQDGLN